MSVRVGLVGTSGWSEFMYLQHLKDFHHGEVVALAGRNEARLQELGDRYGIKHLYSDWQAMIGSGEIDAVLVASPDDLHYEISMAAITAGLHVMCEKPLAMNARQASEMVVAVERAGLINNVMFTFRHLPMFRKVKELLEAGTLGKLYHFDFRFNMGWAAAPDYHWRFDGDRGTGTLGDLGVHDIDLVRWLLGEVSSVYSDTEHSVVRRRLSGEPVTPSNDTSMMILGLENQAKGVITTSVVFQQGDREMDQRLMIYGSEGSIEATLFSAGANQGMRLWLAHHDGSTEEFDFGEDMHEHLGSETVGVRQFVENVAIGRQSGPNFNDGYKAQLVIDAAFESVTSGKRITL